METLRVVVMHEDQLGRAGDNIPSAHRRDALMMVKHLLLTWQQPTRHTRRGQSVRRGKKYRPWKSKLDGQWKRRTILSITPPYYYLRVSIYPRQTNT